MIYSGQEDASSMCKWHAIVTVPASDSSRAGQPSSTDVDYESPDC